MKHVKSNFARISLGDRISCNKTEATMRIQQFSSATVEVRNQIRASANSGGDNRDKKLAVCVAKRTADFLPTKKRRVADDRVEAAVLAPKDLRKFEHPVEWLRRVGVPWTAASHESIATPRLD